MEGDEYNEKIINYYFFSVNIMLKSNYCICSTKY